jgi:hypothetical protein
MIEVRDRCLGEYQFNPGKEWDALRRALFHDRQFVIGGISTRSSEDVPQTSAYIPWREV